MKRHQEASGKLVVFSGMESAWPAWHFVFQRWFSTLSQKMRAEMKEAAKKRQPVMVVAGARETHARSTQLIVSHLGAHGERTSLGNAEITRRKR